MISALGPFHFVFGLSMPFHFHIALKPLSTNGTFELLSREKIKSHKIIYVAYYIYMKEIMKVYL